MRTIRLTRHAPKTRKGIFAVLVGMLLILGLVALALGKDKTGRLRDHEYIVMTQQAVADLSALAGVTELLPGLGYFASKTPAEVASAASDAAEIAAVGWADRNPNADIKLSYIRDIRFGKAIFDNDCPCWVKTPNAEPYNYVEVSVLRNQTATAVILPANGFRIEPGSDDTAPVMPFALSLEVWMKFKRAQTYFDAGGGSYAANDPAMLQDETVLDVTGLPLFGFMERTGGPDSDPNFEYKQLMFDNKTVTDEVVSSGADKYLEINVFPHKGVLSPDEDPGGNFGTIYFGTASNSASEIVRQITEGLNDDDLSYYHNSELNFTEGNPLDTEGDPGVSGGIESALESVVGQCKAIALFWTINAESGNYTTFTLVEFVAITIVEVDLSSGNKRMIMQRCTLVDDNAISNVDEEIGGDTTIFTPPILIE